MSDQVYSEAWCRAHPGWERADPTDPMFEGRAKPKSNGQARPSQSAANDDADDPLQIVRIEPLGRKNIPPRQWAYGRFMLFGSTAVIGAMDGAGKGAYAVVMTLAMITGRPLLDEKVWRKGPVAIITYEDSVEEWHRRIAAACHHYQIDYEDILANVYFLKRKRRICLATRYNGETVFPDSADIIRELKAIGAAMLIIDPFNHAHGMDDGNNNVLIAKVAAEAERIASEANVAVLALHHLRKGGSNGSVDDLMGATSLRATFRSARILARMTPGEGEGIEVPADECWCYIRISGTKENYARPPDNSKWFKMIGVELENTDIDDRYPEGDNVGVITLWTPPPVFGGMDRPTIKAIFDDIRKGPGDDKPFLSARQSDAWVGHVVMHHTNKNDKQAAAITATWLKSGTLVEVSSSSKNRHGVKTAVQLDEAKVTAILGPERTNPAPDEDWD